MAKRDIAFLLLLKHAMVARSDEMNMNIGAIARNAMSFDGKIWMTRDITFLLLLKNAVVAKSNEV